MFAQKSHFDSNELLSVRVLPSLRNIYKWTYVISSDQQFFTTKHLKGVVWGQTRDYAILSSKLNALNQSIC